MKFAICNETFADWPHGRAFEFARQCGYTGIEIAPFTLHDDVRQITAEQRRDLRRAAENAELEVVGLHWLLAKTEGLHLTSPDAEVRRRTAEYLGDLARLCRDLGGRVMVFGSPQQRNRAAGVSTKQALDWAAEVIARTLPALEENHVVLAVEPLGPQEGNFLNTAAEAVTLIERVAAPQCRLHLDCKAMSTESIPIPEIIYQQQAHLEHFHANDPNKLGPGFGELDFVPIFRALREIDYPGFVSVEVFDVSPGIERLARESIKNMRDCLAKLDAE